MCHNDSYNIVEVITLEVNNQLYKNQGVHAISSIFTAEKGITKVLLIQRKNKAFDGMWALVGGALHNDEDLDLCAKREIKEKTGMTILNYHYAMYLVK